MPENFNDFDRPILCFDDVLALFRQNSRSLRDRGLRFEMLMRRYLLAEPQYRAIIKMVWLWNDFPHKNDISGKDTGIDLVTLTVSGEYWAVQCKCYEENHYLSKEDVDTFLATSGKTFGGGKSFARRLFISTTNRWSSEAENALHNQAVPVQKISLADLQKTSEYLDWSVLAGANCTAAGGASFVGEGQTPYAAANSAEDAENAADSGENTGTDGLVSARKPKKTPMPHQKDAIKALITHFETADRAKMIMACGTGKTFTSLKIAEKLTDSSGLVLFLVPSIALLGQTLREWCANAEKTIYPICVCSDATAGKKKDEDDINIADLAMPASTNPDNIYAQFCEARKSKGRIGMIVVFSTYQSIDVVMQAQKAIDSKNPGSFDFSLIICDEAHRTTGVILSSKEESSFTKVHDNANIKAAKRLYMTATPRIYSDGTKQKAAETDCLLCSMDDEAIYGQQAYRITFSEAVDKNLLADYKVLVLTVKEEQLPAIMRHSGLMADGKEIPADDASRLIGCINALSKRVLEADKTFNDDPSCMSRAVAFCPKIKDSKYITELFNGCAQEYYKTPARRRKKQTCEHTVPAYRRRNGRGTKGQPACLAKKRPGGV